jgi:O-methyltransferase involved in polyketide biosynthesis
MAVVAEIDPRTPSIARVYDYLLNGTDNFPVDREVAQRLLAVAPLTAEVTRENRQFLARAVAWAAQAGIRQFIDLGCGMPTVPNTHGTARAIAPDARVLYLDNDPVVLGRLRGLAEDPAVENGDLTVVAGDLREVDVTLDAVAGAIDLAAPACLLMGFLLHFFAPEAARDLVARYAAALAPGSYVVLSAGRGDSDAADSGFGAYSSAGIRVYNHSVADFAGFFGALELVPPGVVDVRAWHPGGRYSGGQQPAGEQPAGEQPAGEQPAGEQPAGEQAIDLEPRDGQVIAGVARVGDAGPAG